MSIFHAIVVLLVIRWLVPAFFDVLAFIIAGGMLIHLLNGH